MAPFIAMSSAATPIIWQYYINVKCGYVYKKSVPVFHKKKIHSLSHISLVEMVENKLCFILFQVRVQELNVYGNISIHIISP